MNRPMVKMEQAASYDEWRLAAMAYDEHNGAAAWKRTDRSSRYDYKIIRKRRDELLALREAGDAHAMLFWLNEGIHGNMGGMGSPRMYTRAKFGTKNLIREYIEEMIRALEFVAEVPEEEIPFADKLDFFRRASLCFGRSALMLSGGGALGPFHIGVVKALMEQDLLPDVISGSSAGSVIGAILGTQDEMALESLFDPRYFTQRFGPLSDEGVEALKGHNRISLDRLHQLVESLIPDLTFEEAFQRTGRKINISVSPRDVHQQSRLLNAITSPNVYVREAVLASCAIPGIFPPVTLAAKNARGERQPYVPSRQWVDGSVTDDLPAKRLTRLYGVNHFITSQTNPAVLWSLRDPNGEDLFSRLWNVYQNASKEWFRATYPFAMQITKDLYPLNVITRMSYSVAIQDYTADINILPRRKFWDPRKLLSVLSEDETRYLIREGELATWPKIEMIRNCTQVSRVLDRILQPMEHRYAHENAGGGIVRV